MWANVLCTTVLLAVSSAFPFYGFDPHRFGFCHADDDLDLGFSMFHPSPYTNPWHQRIMTHPFYCMPTFHRYYALPPRPVFKPWTPWASPSFNMTPIPRPTYIIKIVVPEGLLKGDTKNDQTDIEKTPAATATATAATTVVDTPQAQAANSPENTDVPPKEEPSVSSSTVPNKEEPSTTSDHVPPKEEPSAPVKEESPPTSDGVSSQAEPSAASSTVPAKEETSTTNSDVPSKEESSAPDNILPTQEEKTPVADNDEILTNQVAAAPSEEIHQEPMENNEINEINDKNHQNDKLDQLKAGLKISGADESLTSNDV